MQVTSLGNKNNPRSIKLGPVVQSIISLLSLLVVKMLTVLISTISYLQVFLLKKNVSSFCKCKSCSYFFIKNINIYAVFNDQSFIDMLTNGIISFEQLDPGCQAYTDREDRSASDKQKTSVQTEYTEWSWALLFSNSKTFQAFKRQCLSSH